MCPVPGLATAALEAKAICLANRSLAFLKLGEVQRAVEDATQAVMCDERYGDFFLSF